MVIAVAFDTVKDKQTRKVSPTGTLDTILFFGSKEAPELPHAKLAIQSHGRITQAHFHEHDQFQVVVDGTCKFGRHDLGPYSVHFSRAYTPYGPLVPGLGKGVSFFTFRAHYDRGSQRISQARDRLKQIPNREPWQITRNLSFPVMQLDAAIPGMLLQADPDIKNEEGLAIYTLSMQPNAQAFAPDPARGDGQYLLVVRGSLWHQSQEYQAPVVVFVFPHESAFPVHAGASGMEALILNFPYRRVQ